jgi:hypothetical protein
MPGETPAQTCARLSNHVQRGGASWADYSVGELWAIVKHRCADRRNRRGVDQAYSMMETLGGEFDAQKATDVIAAVLTRNKRPLREDGVLTNADLAAFLQLC